MKFFTRIKNTLLLAGLVIGALTTNSLVAEDLLLDCIFTNDIHGGIDRYPATFMNPEFPPMIGGGASAATFIKKIKSLEKNGKRDNLVIDAGDFFQGHPIGTMTDGRAVIEYMNAIGYDLTVIGNHEYDIGEERLVKTLKTAKFPVLSCNIISKETGKIVDYAKPYIMVEKMGVKIGIIGVTTLDTKDMSFADHIKNVDFLPAKEQLNKYVPIVKEKGADIVVVVGHLGLPYNPEPEYQKRYVEKRYKDQERRWGYDAQELAHEVEGIDIIFGGHMHKGFKEPWADPKTHTLVVQGYAMGSSIGLITLKIDPETKTISGWEDPSIQDGLLITLMEEEIHPDAEIKPIIDRNLAIAEKGMDEIIGESSVYLSKSGSGAQSVMGNLVMDAMLSSVDGDFSFMNLGGIRGEIGKGPITYRDVFNVIPFDNSIVVLNITGKKLKEIVEFRVSGGRHGLRISGGKVVYTKQKPDFSRILSFEVQGQPVQDDKIYRVVTTDFLLSGNAGLTMLTQIPDEQIERPELSVRDEVVNFIRRKSPVESKIDDRWNRAD